MKEIAGNMRVYNLHRLLLLLPGMISYRVNI
jgi:hypothetical protein